MFTAAFSGISVNDIKAARTFYCETLGLRLLDDSMGLELELPKRARMFIYEKAGHKPASFTVMNFVVNSIDKTQEELSRKGVTFEIYDLGNGADQDEKGILRGLSANMGPDIAWFKDPAGNVLAILQEK